MFTISRADRATRGGASCALENGMICGHIGVALGTRALSRDVPLGWLLAGAIAPDVLDVAEAALRMCNPNGLYSHSLPATAALMLVLGIAAYAHVRTARAAVAVGLMVLLHLLLDFVTGEKVLWAGGPLLGFDLYRWPQLDFALELPVIVGGWWLLRRAATDRRWITSWAMLAALLIVQAAINAMQLQSISIAAIVRR